MYPGIEGPNLSTVTVVQCPDPIRNGNKDTSKYQEEYVDCQAYSNLETRDERSKAPARVARRVFRLLWPRKSRRRRAGSKNGFLNMEAAILGEWVV